MKLARFELVALNKKGEVMQTFQPNMERSERSDVRNVLAQFKRSMRARGYTVTLRKV